jgi:hypothetical protein
LDINAVVNRILRLARLDTSAFDEVRDDQRETIPAIAIVVVSCLLAGFGAWMWLIFVAPDGVDVDHGKVIVNVFLLGTIVTTVVWAVWVAVTAMMLNSVYKEHVDLMSLMRTMGYASFPFALSMLMLVPMLSFGVALFAVGVWVVLSIFAVQAATTAESDRVIKANLVGFFVFAIVLGLLARNVGLASGVFVNSESRTIAEGEFFKVDLDLDFE